MPLRVLVLGCNGMLGHKVGQVLGDSFEVWGTVRGEDTSLVSDKFLPPDRIIAGVDATELSSLENAFHLSAPDAVINCIGIIPQNETSKNPIACIGVNSMFVHQLAALCRNSGTRLIHISTDCVFSGAKGMYTETDFSDSRSLYGRTKYLGEVDTDRCLTIRTSIIGRELTSFTGLLEWFLSNRNGSVQGYTNAFFSGFSTLALSNIIGELLENHPNLSGLYHVSTERISKYDLLCQIRKSYGLKTEIKSAGEFQIDRSLDSTKFRQKTGIIIPLWSDIITEMAMDSAPYEE